MKDIKFHKIDLNKYWIKAIKDFLIENKFTKFKELSDSLLATRVNNYFRKGGMSIRWKINISDDFFEKNNVDDDECQCINDILYSLREGEGAYNYLSANSKKFGSKNIDFLFNRLEVTHFHLDKLNEKTKKGRSEKLLFVHLDYSNKVATVVGLYGHKRWFDNEILLDYFNVVHEVQGLHCYNKKAVQIISPDLYTSKKSLYFIKVIYDDGSDEIIMGNPVVSTSDSEWDVRVADEYYRYLDILSTGLNDFLSENIVNNTDYIKRLNNKNIEFCLKINDDLKMDLIDEANDVVIELEKDIDVMILRYFL